MNNPERALVARIKELRRRQFGPRGKAEFARRLGVPLEEYERYERGTVPPGDVLVRMCELTGEDLQWLLTGVAARGTVVISGTRSRHQKLLTKLAQLLDEQPERAGPVEAFVDLLIGGEQVLAESGRQLPLPPTRDLIPIFAAGELPLTLPETGTGGLNDSFPPVLLPETAQLTERKRARLAEPAGEYNQDDFRNVEMVTHTAEDGQVRQFVHSPEIARCVPGLFGVRLEDDTMTPMFQAGDAVLSTLGSAPQVGHPVLCRLNDDPVCRCRIWLDQDEESVHLGRLSDGELEHVVRKNVCWSLEVLYRLTPAA